MLDVVTMPDRAGPVKGAPRHRWGPEWSLVDGWKLHAMPRWFYGRAVQCLGLDGRHVTAYGCLDAAIRRSSAWDRWTFAIHGSARLAGHQVLGVVTADDDESRKPFVAFARILYLDRVVLKRPDDDRTLIAILPPGVGAGNVTTVTADGRTVAA